MSSVSSSTVESPIASSVGRKTRSSAVAGTVPRNVIVKESDVPARPGATSVQQSGSTPST